MTAKLANLIVGLLIGIFTPQSASASITTIDFESLTGMSFFSGAPIPNTSKLSNQLLSSYGVAFSSADPYVAVVALGAGHATSGINGIGASNGNGVLTYDKASPIVIEFFDPANLATKGITNFVSIRGDQGGGGQTVTLRAYDLFDSFIAEATAIDFGGPILSIAASGIHSVRFFGTQDLGGVALDDLTFEQPTVGSVSEPGILMLVLSSLGMLFIARAFGIRRS